MTLNSENDRRLLVVMQTLHRERNGRLELDPLHAGMVQLVAGSFSHVTLAAPVGTDYQDETLGYPGDWSFAPLFRRSYSTPRHALAWKHLSSILVLLREVRRADVVHVRLPSLSSLIGGAVAIALRKPIIASFHGHNFRKPSQTERPEGPAVNSTVGVGICRAVYRMISRKAVLNLVSGENLMGDIDGPAEIVAHHQFRSDDIFCREDTCTAEPTNLLYVGRVSHEKGIVCLLDAMAELRRGPGQWHLTLVGAPWKIDIDHEIDVRGLRDAITLAGIITFGPHLFEYYRSADMLVFPSFHEGMPKVPMEALSQSLPVIAADTATGQYIKDEQTGLVVPPGNAEALVAAIRKMKDCGPLRKSCIRNGLAVARANTREAMHERIDTLVAPWR